MAAKNKTDRSTAWQPATRLVHEGTLRSQFGETSEAIFLNSGYVYESAEQAEARFKGDEDGYVYSRYANPTVSMFETRMCALEGAEAARGTASGMAAVAASLLCHLKAGDHVVSGRALFGSCRYIVEDLLPRYGVTSTLVDGRDLAAWEAAVTPNTRAFFFESPTNPVLELVDIEGVAKIAKGCGALTVVDNVFATPLGQRPMALGADIVVYSATKHIDGQGRCLGGVVLGPAEFIDESLHTFLKHTGPSLSPFNAWVMLKGLETLPLRVARHNETAARIAEFLAERSEVERVFYPGRTDHPQHDLAKRQMTGGGPIVAFEIKGGKKAAFRFLNALSIFKISNNLGDAKSLATHPATTTHQRLSEEARSELGIFDTTIRLSIGLEDAGDLEADLDQALAAARG
ncbi:O-succinylhomoserine sulfhydrylase [Methyloceanibacter superfactus]|uniref:O-succinylhomoserine sulfhydrylase n=1 Tax=Methyloceanibacter superfactus TaxID=1774969 RepID=A0A1E3W3Y9_9HYPH|nr:O-succinylhomoserine sulfhydrylase [Methyloceanibacter superfactus]ODS00450.1 O-succinylhomoserine sulfhydrylase [Methyloceanibacter superfactus]